MSRPPARVPAAVVAVLAAVAAMLLGASGAHAQSSSASPPQITAPSAILVQPDTGDVVYQRDANERRPIASTTKIMTALVVRDELGLDDVVRAIDYRATPAESLLGQAAGERFTVRDELRALLLVSANDAAATLAVRAGGTRAKFVALMNRKARALGLRNTHFDNPIGLDGPGNYSTASDLAKLALIARRDPFLRETMNRPDATLRSGARVRTIQNRNTLVDTQPFVNGVKTGHTNVAGYLLVGSASRDGVEVVSVVMKEPSEAARDRDSLALLRYGVSRYVRRTGVRRGEQLATATLQYRDERVALVAERAVRAVTRRGERLAIRVSGAPTTIAGPLPRGARVGTVEVSLRGRRVASVPLVTESAVDAATAVERLSDFVSRPLTIVLLVAFVVASVLLVALRRRAGQEARRRPRRAATGP